MLQIPIQQLPNQSFSVILDNNTWNILIKTCNGITAVSMTVNNVDILDSAMAVAGSFIIPYRYLENGNFFFVTQNQELPIYTQFNVTQQLVYISAAELAAIRVPSPVPITAAFFNPLGALPLRFAPQGYTEA